MALSKQILVLIFISGLVIFATCKKAHSTPSPAPAAGSIQPEDEKDEPTDKPDPSELPFPDITGMAPESPDEKESGSKDEKKDGSKDEKKDGSKYEKKKKDNSKDEKKKKDNSKDKKDDSKDEKKKKDDSKDKKDDSKDEKKKKDDSKDEKDEKKKKDGSEKDDSKDEKKKKDGSKDEKKKKDGSKDEKNKKDGSKDEKNKKDDSKEEKGDSKDEKKDGSKNKKDDSKDRKKSGSKDEKKDNSKDEKGDSKDEEDDSTNEKEGDVATMVAKQMRKIKERINEFNALLKKQMDNPGASSHGSHECVLECDEVLGAALDDIKKTLDSLDNQNLVKANFDVSAVSTNVDTCNDCFDEMVGGDPEAKKLSDWVQKTTRDALEILQKGDS